MIKKYSRQEFISFLGAISVGSIILPPFILGCGNSTNPISNFQLSSNKISRLRKTPLKNLVASDQDDLILTQGLSYYSIIKWGEKISSKDTFGFNNDYICFIPFDQEKPNDGLLWVNHEYIDPLFVSGFNNKIFSNHDNQRTKEQVDKEMYNVGGSIIRIKEIDGKWTVIQDDPFNRRITGKTPIKLNWDVPIKGKTSVIGTHSNCSGGVTPWKTFLSCEENYDQFYGETIYNSDGSSQHVKSYFGWEDFYNYPSEHYGWVVEVDPKDGSAQKHIALGRFAHECCTIYELDDKRVVAYTGDDKNDEHLYKFISSKPGSLKEGILYVANIEMGKWEPLDWETQPILKKKFKDQTEVLIRAREASKLIGATKLNRPEDIKIDPITGNIFIALSNNKTKGDYHGSIMKLEEQNGDFDSLKFSSSTYISGGDKLGFSCPDNLSFDLSGNLWFTTDMSASLMNKVGGVYMPFKNNSLFVIPRYGKQAGEVIRVASAPIDAELTGPWFSPDGKTLFLSIQHPGEQTTNINTPTSRWPFDTDNIPKPSVVAIKGDLIEKLNYLNQIEKSS